METNSSNHTMIKLVVVFVILNSLALGMLFWKEQKSEGRAGGPPPVPEFERAMDFLSRELHLTQSQVTQLYFIRTNSLEKGRRIHQLMMSQRDSIQLLVLRKSPNLALAEAIAARISENEHKMGLQKIDQALEIQKLCTSSQLEKLSFYQAEIHQFLKPDHRPPPSK